MHGLFYWRVNVSACLYFKIGETWGWKVKYKRRGGKEQSSRGFGEGMGFRFSEALEKNRRKTFLWETQIWVSLDSCESLRCLFKKKKKKFSNPTPRDFDWLNLRWSWMLQNLWPEILVILFYHISRFVRVIFKKQTGKFRGRKILWKVFYCEI